MTLHTDLTRLLDIKHPMLSAPMDSVAGARLAAAVSNAGGLGLVGCGYGDPSWIQRELTAVVRATDKPWGAGVITWSITPAILALILDFEPHALVMSFGEAEPYVDTVKKTGCKLICQVQTLADAKKANAVGVDAIVAQGTEAGGHGGGRSTLPFVPAVVDMVGDTPVVAAGGIADGRGLAAALALGAKGVLMGTRFYASAEALGTEDEKHLLVKASGDDTLRTTVFDIAGGLRWPTEFTDRVIKNEFTERWHGQETALRSDSQAQSELLQQAMRESDWSHMEICASEAADLITSVEAAGDLVRTVIGQAERAIEEIRMTATRL